MNVAETVAPSPFVASAGIPAAPSDVLSKCLVKDTKQRVAMAEMLQHEWFASEEREVTCAVVQEEDRGVTLSSSFTSKTFDTLEPREKKMKF